MGRSKHLTKEEKFAIGILDSLGCNHDKIAEALGRHRTCIDRYLKHRHEVIEEKRGRPSVINDRTIRQIKRLVVSTPCTTKYIKYILNINASNQTIRNNMRRNDITWQAMEKVIPLSKRNKSKRFDFAKFHLKEYFNWDDVYFSDEKPFYLDGPRKPMYCWTISKNKKKLIKRHSHGGMVMVWGAIGLNYKSDLVFIDGYLNQFKYKAILEEHVSGMVRSDTFYQHDNCRCHVSKLIKQWFSERNMNVLDWPAQSPDLNLIENIWASMDEIIYANGKQYSSKNEIILAIQKAWGQINFNLIKNIYKSMPRRLVQCLLNKGGETNY